MTRSPTSEFFFFNVYFIIIIIFLIANKKQPSWILTDSPVSAERDGDVSNVWRTRSIRLMLRVVTDVLITLFICRFFYFT